MSRPTPTVMISSTAIDLPDHRKQVVTACEELGIRPIGMERWPAHDATPLESSLAMVEQADAFVLILGGRYGSKPPGSQASFVELEFDHASDRKIPRFVFLADDAHQPPMPAESEGEDGERLTAFRNRVARQLTLRAFKSTDQLFVLVASSLATWLVNRAGSTPFGTILTHDDYIAGLQGFREYLLSTKLPFQLPPAHDPAHPDVLLQRLEERAGSGGVLISAPGGSGKTRTATEVANRASAAGWRVLHVAPGEPGVTVEDLAAVLFAAPRQPSITLLVFDYLDQMGPLDLVAVRQRLLPQAARQGTRIALLANSRPGWLARENFARDALFDRVDLKNDDDRTMAIASAIVNNIAPAAVQLLGESVVRELCGERPIVAMFIARELQRRAADGSLDDTGLGLGRNGDLLHWLRRRLNEDGYLVPAGTILGPSKPEAHVVAAAAGLAAAPLSEGEIVAVVHATLSAIAVPGEECAVQAAYVVGILRYLGWLEVHGASWYAAHDVVTDEMVGAVLHQRPTDLVRPQVLEAVLAGAQTSARALGRFAASLHRQLGAVNAGFRERLEAAAVTWLQKHASHLGRMLAQGDSDTSAYALGAILGNAPWADAVPANWGELVHPWLKTHGKERSARHLLYRGLKLLPAEKSIGLIATAMAWLRLHGQRLEASFVLTPLLDRHDLAVSTSAVLDASLSWLEGYGTSTPAGFVLAPLLGRTELEGAHAQTAIAAALAWLAEFGTTSDAPFVLRPLLGRTDLERGHAQEAISAARAWLAEFGTTSDAPFVLAPLLGRTDLEDTHAQAAISAALTWLAEYGNPSAAQFVLAPLLGRTDLEDAHAQLAISAALAWLAEFGTTSDAPFVLHSLLRRSDLDAAEASTAIAHGADWLETHPTARDAGFVLPPLLARLEAGDDGSRIVRQALCWLEQHATTTDAEFVLRRLLSRRDISEAQLVRCRHLALEELRRKYRGKDASFLLRWCLNDREMPRSSITEVQRLALAWMDSNPRHADRDFVFNRLLRTHDLDDSTWERAAAHAIRWLPHGIVRRGFDYAVNSLSTRPHLLTVRERRFIVTQGLVWLKDPEHSGNAAPAVAKNLKKLVMDPLQEGELDALATTHVAWLGYDKSFAAVVESLRAQASMERVDVPAIAAALPAVRAQAVANPRSCAFAIPPLWAIGIRQQDSDLLAEARRLVGQLLSKERSLAEHNRRGLARALLRIARELNLDTQAADRFLQDVGLTS